jgi:hypothetical protein
VVQLWFKSNIGIEQVNVSEIPLAIWIIYLFQNVLNTAYGGIKWLNHRQIVILGVGSANSGIP